MTKARTTPSQAPEDESGLDRRGFLKGAAAAGAATAAAMTAATQIAQAAEAKPAQPEGEANMAKMLAADASWEAANACVQTHGGFAFAEEYDVERKFRETRLYQVAPISTNLILSFVAEHVLGMPRSY